MALQRYPQSANDQAALLFAVAGSLPLLRAKPARALRAL